MSAEVTLENPNGADFQFGSPNPNDVEVRCTKNINKNLSKVLKYVQVVCQKKYILNLFIIDFQFFI